MKQNWFIEIPKHATCHVFAETTHVVATPPSFTRAILASTWLLYSKFHRNLFGGFGAMEGVDNCSLVLLWLMAFTTARATVQAMIKCIGEIISGQLSTLRAS